MAAYFKGLILHFFILFSLETIAQSRFYESLELEINDQNQRKFSTVGGFDNPQFSEIDLNGDGINDLFVFDRKYNVVRTFLYNSTDSNYSYNPEFERFFPNDMTHFTLLRDVNCDGYPDIFTFYQGGFKVYKNDGVFPLSFSLLAEKLKSKYGSISTSAFVLAGDVPAIVDIDGDGDLDILTFGLVSSENTIEFHKNLSMDSLGTCDSLWFQVTTQCWGNFQEPSNSSYLEAISCKGIITPQSGGRDAARHAGSTVLLIDLDDDGDKDLIVGDIATSTLVRAINSGDASSANIDVNQQTTAFPSSMSPAEIPFLVAGYEIDVDHNGAKDLILAPNNTIDSSANSEHTWYYKNTQFGAPIYQQITKQFLLEDMLDLGSSAVPVMMDVNSDGLADLLIAVEFKKTPSSSLGSRLYLYTQNFDGTFHLQSSNYANLAQYNLDAMSPTLGDLDNDGDLDMIIGTSDGKLHFVRNHGSSITPNFNLVESNYMGINSISGYASPTLGDVNGNGLMDLIVGQQTGILSYFENFGSISSPLFHSTPTIDTLGKIDVSKYCCLGYSSPRFIENEIASGKYLLIGSDEKKILVYKIENDLNAAFGQYDSISVNAGRIAPWMEDIDEDGIYEILVGTGEGGIKFYDRDGNYPWATSEVLNFKKLTVYPNPANDKISIRGLNQGASYNLSNILGQDIKKGIYNSFIDVSDLKPGNYILKSAGYEAKMIIISR